MEKLEHSYNFHTKKLGQDFHHYSTIDSTQTRLKEMFLKGEAKLGTLILADHQQVGRGTKGRSWFSLPKPQLMFSVVLKPVFPPQKLPILNILSGILLIQAFDHNERISPKIKWPNDIYIDGKKVAGILSELLIQNKETFILLGIGVNVEGQVEDFPVDLRETASALSLHYGNVDRIFILDQFLQRLEKILDTMSSEEIIVFTQKEFEKLWIYQHRTIEVVQDDKVIRGTARNIDANGALHIETAYGIKKIISGIIEPV